MANDLHQISDQALLTVTGVDRNNDRLSEYRPAAPAQTPETTSLQSARAGLPEVELEAHLERNSQGQVTSVQYPDGSSMQCHYNVIGDLSAVSTKDGGWWVKQPDNSFQLFENKRYTGKKMECIMVDDQTGAVEYFNRLPEKLDKVSRDSDIVFTNGTTVSLDRNPAGTSTERVTFATGDTQTIFYGTNGRASQISYGIQNSLMGGVSWIKEGDTWTQYDDSGDTTGAILPKGAWISSGASLNSSDVSWIHYPDGSSDVTLTNGDIVHRDNSDRVVQVIDLHGQTESFEYLPSGQVGRITNKDGLTWQSANGEWQQFDKKGKPTGMPLYGLRSVASTEGGDLRFLPAYM